MSLQTIINVWAVLALLFLFGIVIAYATTYGRRGASGAPDPLGLTRRHPTPTPPPDPTLTALRCDLDGIRTDLQETAGVLGEVADQVRRLSAPSAPHDPSTAPGGLPLVASSWPAPPPGHPGSPPPPRSPQAAPHYAPAAPEWEDPYDWAAEGWEPAPSTPSGSHRVEPHPSTIRTHRLGPLHPDSPPPSS